MAPVDHDSSLNGPQLPDDPRLRSLLANIPQTQRYEESWMHRGEPTHVACSPTGASEFFLTGSSDGRVKLWRSTALTHSQKKSKGTVASDKVILESARQGVCLEFVKDFQAHQGPVEQIVVSSDGTYAASIGNGENVVKVYNLRTYDLFAVRKLPFTPACITIANKRSPEDAWLIASDRNSNQINVFNLIRDLTKESKDLSGNFEDDDELIAGHIGGTNHGAIHSEGVHQDEDTKSSCEYSTEKKRNEPEGGLILMGENKKRKEEQEAKEKRQKDVLEDINIATVVWTLNRHYGPVHKMCYLPTLGLVASADRFGGLEIWPLSLFDEDVSVPPQTIQWSSKLETDLFEMVKKKTYARALAVTPYHGGLIAAFCGDAYVRIWRIRDGKLIREFDETTRTITMNQMEASGQHSWRKIDNFDFGRRVGVEKELMADSVGDDKQGSSITNFPKLDRLDAIQFDDSGEIVVFTNLEGIKVLHWEKEILLSIIGRGEQLRFLNFALFQASPLVSKDIVLKGRPPVVDNPHSLEKRRFLLLACALNKRRFFVFSHLEPLEDSFVVGSAESRDHLNEAPTKEEREIGMQRAKEKLRLRFGSGFAVIHTNKGDIRIQLHMEATPKTVENFVTHSRNGYYDGLIFHRVIKGFMIQTGCPHGKGTGGESIWGGHFNDEIVADLRHDRPYMVSMANAGAGTNGSQFFITMVPCPHLDGKHTIFGKVVEGHDICHMIENVTTNREDRPYEDIKMVSIKVEE
eukprot:GHVH01012299.1.p1 GENE.GHVH01012299.1~~GHVH01012299.1.p1  ORF type:complete len:765 (+),score=104.00 GHVH01012299.1:54-2297(+)